jgi:segregation and condensation protein A
VETRYEVKTDHFEGPLDLLLDMIEKRKLFINDISLSAIADDYISYVQKMENFPVSYTANFVLVASTLVLIKSKSLLPNLELNEEEKESIEDLELRLKIYKEFKAISKKIGEMYGSNIIYAKLENRNRQIVFSPPEKLSLLEMQNSIQNVLKNLPIKAEPPRATVKKIMSLEEMMDNLAKRVESSLRLSFRSFASKEEKVNAIVGFLAMLELVKRGVISVKQDATFSDIEMHQTNPSIPNYS